MEDHANNSNHFKTEFCCCRPGPVLAGRAVLPPVVRLAVFRLPPPAGHAQDGGDDYGAGDDACAPEGLGAPPVVLPVLAALPQAGVPVTRVLHGAHLHTRGYT